MAIRQNIRQLSAPGGSIDAIRASFDRAKSLTDDRGYDWFASIHALSMPIWCEHGTALFLPWHRAFLYFFELALQTRLGARFSVQQPADSALGDVGLPWWDWTSVESHASGLPDAYEVAQIGGADNPFFDSEIGAAGGRGYATGVWSQGLLDLVRQRLPGTVTATGLPRTLRDPDPPDDLPRASSIANFVMPQTTFTGFSTALEQSHNQVHGWVGGAMSQVPTAAYDPIFWSHHAMIDRIWYLWQISPNGAQPPASLMDVILTPFPMTVRQTLDVSNLGYDYAVGVVP